MKKGCFCSRKARNVKKRDFFEAKMQLFSKNVIFDQKKGACGKPPAEKKCLFPGETLFLGKKKRRLRQAASWREKFSSKISDFFFFSNFLPDLGDESGYNRLSF